MSSFRLEMEESKEGPSEINRYHVVNALKKIKKRKFRVEQLDLPVPKHLCLEGVFPSEEPVSMFDEDPEVEKIQKHVIKGELVERVMLDDGSGLESGNGSNSFSGDCDSATLVYVEAKLQPVYEMACLYDRPSASSLNCTEEPKFSEGEHRPMCPDGEIQALENLDEHFQELRHQADFICSEYGDDFKQCTDKEFEDTIYPNCLNPNTFVLSSGRWSVDQEVQSATTRKPTIDQEFEQYFSMLML